MPVDSKYKIENGIKISRRKLRLSRCVCSTLADMMWRGLCIDCEQGEWLKGLVEFLRKDAPSSHYSFSVFTNSWTCVKYFPKGKWKQKMENKPKQGEKKISPACLHPSCKTLCSTGCLSLESSHLLGRSQGTCLSVQRGIKFPFCPQRAWVAVTGGAAVGPAGYRPLEKPHLQRQGRMAMALALMLYGYEFLKASSAEKGAFLTVLLEDWVEHTGDTLPPMSAKLTQPALLSTLTDSVPVSPETPALLLGFFDLLQLSGVQMSSLTVQASTIINNTLTASPTI